MRCRLRTKGGWAFHPTAQPLGLAVGCCFVRAFLDPFADWGRSTGETDQAVDQLSAAEQAQGRNALDAVAYGEVLVVVDVKLADLDLAGELVRKALHDRRHHVARRAPLGGEINDHRLGGIEHVGLEGRAVEVLKVLHVEYKALRPCRIPRAPPAQLRHLPTSGEDIIGLWP